MISVYTICKIFILNRKRLSDARVASVTKKEYAFVALSCKDSQSLKGQ